MYQLGILRCVLTSYRPRFTSYSHISTHKMSNCSTSDTVSTSYKSQHSAQTGAVSKNQIFVVAYLSFISDRILSKKVEAADRTEMPRSFSISRKSV